VLISGEAGIGKSRLTAALLERLASEPHTRLRYFCSPQHTDSALYPIIGHMERAAGLAHHDAQQAKLDKLDALLAQTSTSIEDAALFAEMLSLGNDDRYPTLGLTPQQRRRRTLDALLNQVEALTRQGPVLMILEDAHWADPTSLEVFGRLMHRIAPLQALVIVTFRTEFEPPWMGQPHVTAMTLNRLPRREVNDMIDRVAGNKPLPASTRQNIIERTDGIPLFVEEMTKAVLEAGSEGEARLTVPGPGSPRELARIADGASRPPRPAKELVQIGAAIGREFPHSLLASVVRKPEAELASALNRVVEAGLLFRQGMPPHATYLFKHALVQDAAYGTLLRERRRALHARIAEAFETEFADTAENQPELLAHHCTEAGLIEKAAGLWGKAGQRSLARSALLEAVAQLTRALTQIAALPRTSRLRQEQINLQVGLTNALMHFKGYAAPETQASLDQARLLIEQAEAQGEPPEDPLLLFSVLFGYWVANYIAFNGDALRELAVQFLTLAKKQGEVVPLMIGHRLMGSSLAFTGALAEGRLHYDKAIALYDPAKHRPLAMRFGQDIAVIILSNRSLALWLLGYPEAALADTDYALKHAREIGHPVTLMSAFIHASMTLVFCGDYSAANANTDEVVALAEQKGASHWKSSAMTMRGSLCAVTNNALSAVQFLTSGIATSRSMGQTWGLSINLSNLARAYAELEQFESAWRCIDEALRAARVTKESCWEADIYRTAGEIALMATESDAAKADVYFERALAVAREQQAKSLELRAAMSMARLWRDQGKRQQAHDLLAPVYGWFTEGFDTLDLKEAKVLLDELAS
jgi:predicted ATPase